MGNFTLMLYGRLYVKKLLPEERLTFFWALNYSSGPTMMGPVVNMSVVSLLSYT